MWRRRSDRLHGRASDRGRFLGSVVVAAVTIAAAATATVGSPVGPVGVATAGTQDTTAAAARPNILLFLTDDQRPDQLAHMTSVRALLQTRGITFDRAFTPDPLCCPSRVSILRGQSSQRTGVWAVSGAYGGFTMVRQAKLETSTIATWLHGAGYRTALVGKYLNGYSTPGAAYVPPGWDYWRAMTRLDPTAANGGYYHYGISVNGVERLYGDAPTDYSTTVLTRYARTFISSTPTSTPFFLELSFRAPHTPSTPAPGYTSDPRCGTVDTRGLAGFNEQDVSDKPTYIASKPSLSAVEVTRSGINRPRKACRALLSVDDAVRSVMNDLSASGRLSNTLIVFTADNGILFGEHRWQGKKVPYWQSNHVPFIVRYDPLTLGRAGTVNHAMVENIDLASTWAQAAGIVPPIPQDGRSLIPLLSGTATPWRSEVLLQAFDVAGQESYVPGYCGLETADGWVYIRYDAATEARNQELYDLSVDPGELENLAYAPAYAQRRDALLARLQVLCRPGPPGFAW